MLEIIKLEEHDYIKLPRFQINELDDLELLAVWVVICETTSIFKDLESSNVKSLLKGKFGLGINKTNRILTKLRNLGYIKVEFNRDPNGCINGATYNIQEKWRI